ncbi:hypothetical protein INR49_017998 [Caranx melampygus]|nr:hypothetical protein INR49_017998 [Caranx melampygus]
MENIELGLKCVAQSELHDSFIQTEYRSRPLGSLWANAAFGNAPEKDDVNRKKNTTAVANSM